MKSAFSFVIAGSVLMGLGAMGERAAVAGDGPSTINMNIVREKVHADKKFFVAQHMGLKDSEAEVFWPVYDRYQKELEAITDRSRALIRQYAKNFRTMSNDVAKKLIDEHLLIQSDRVKLRQAYLPQFREVISDIMVARYYQIENKVQAVIDYGIGSNIPLIR